MAEEPVSRVDEKLGMHPPVDARVRGPEIPLILRHLVRVVKLAMVHAAGVDIERRAQVLQAHYRAFEVPAGEPPAPRAVPLHEPRGAGWRQAPHAEVPGLALAGIGRRAGSGLLAA